MIENWTEIGFAGLAAGILWMTFKWMTNELNKKIDDLQDIIIKLSDAKNTMVDKFQEMNDEVTDQLNYIEAKLGNGRGSKQRRKAGK
jgi:predicted  nucleic acid-binding Zn-ribbon protein